MVQKRNLFAGGDEEANCIGKNRCLSSKQQNEGFPAATLLPDTGKPAANLTAKTNAGF